MPPAPRKRGRSRLLVGIGALLLLAGGLGALAFFAVHNDWVDVFGSSSPAKTQAAFKEDTTVIFQGEKEALSAATGNTIQPGGSDSSTVWLRSSLQTAKSSGATDGASVKVPNSLSSRLAGRRIRVTISAGRGNAGALSPFAVAYSTGAAGNSGWIVFQPSRNFEDYSFVYRVPRRSAGSTHYVGLWSDITGQELPLAVRKIAITVLP